MEKNLLRLLKRNPLRVISLFWGWIFSLKNVGEKNNAFPVVFDTPGLGIKINKHKSGKIIINGTLIIGKRGAREPYGNVVINMAEDSTLIINGTVSLGANVHLAVAPGAKLILGSKADGSLTINRGTEILAHEEIRIGSGSMLSWDILIMDSNVHTIVGAQNHKAIIIHEHVWIGCRATILKGVELATGSVVSASAVVVKSVPAKSIVAGNPAKIVKENICWLE